MENKKKQQPKQYNFDRHKFLEEFVQYKLTPEAESDFRAHAKMGAKAALDIIEKNISVLIHTSNAVTELPKNKRRYQFSGFVALTNEDEKTVNVVYWVNKKLKVSKAMSNELKKKFGVIGLDSTGFALLKEEPVEEVAPIEVTKIEIEEEKKETSEETPLEVVETQEEANKEQQ